MRNRACGALAGLIILAATPAARAEDAGGPLVRHSGPEASVSVHILPAAATLLRRASLATIVGGGPKATGYEEVCTSGCNISVPAGTYNLSVTLDGKEVPESIPVRLPPGPSNLEATLESRSGTRVAGWSLIAAGPVVAYGTLMGFKLAHDGDAVRGGEIAVGLAVGAALVTTGIVLATRADRATFVVLPVGARESGHRLGAMAAAARAF